MEKNHTFVVVTVLIRLLSFSYKEVVVATVIVAIMVEDKWLGSKYGSSKW